MRTLPQHQSPYAQVHGLVGEVLMGEVIVTQVAMKTRGGALEAGVWGLISHCFRMLGAG